MRSVRLSGRKRTFVGLFSYMKVDIHTKYLLVDNEAIRVWKKDGIVFCEYKPNLYVDMKVAKLTVESRQLATGGKDLPVFVDIRNLNRVEEEARKYLASKEAGENIKALAIIKAGFIVNLFANWFLKIDKPPFPTKLFTGSQMEMAVRWLELFKPEQEN